MMASNDDIKKRLAAFGHLLQGTSETKLPGIRDLLLPSLVTEFNELQANFEEIFKEQEGLAQHLAEKDEKLKEVTTENKTLQGVIREFKLEAKESAESTAGAKTPVSTDASCSGILEPNCFVQINNQNLTRDMDNDQPIRHPIARQSQGTFTHLANNSTEKREKTLTATEQAYAASVRAAIRSRMVDLGARTESAGFKRRRLSAASRIE